MAYVPPLDTSSTEVSAGPMDHAGELAPEPGPAAEPLLALGLIKSSWPSEDPVNVSKQHSLAWYTLPPNPKETYEGLCLCLSVRGLRCSNFSQCSPEHQTPTNITSVADLEPL